jgi:hypothetical protein
MKITVVGAILIVATVMAGVLLFLALTENTNGVDRKQDDVSEQDQFWQSGTGT